MSGIVKFTEASSLALHAMAILAAQPEQRVQIQAIGARLSISTNHLAKVMQRLCKVGLIESVRGRGGGFLLRRDPAEVSMLEVYEAVEGPLEICHCLFSPPKCCGDCILGDTLATANSLVREKLSRTHLSHLAALFEPKLGTQPQPALRSIRSPRGGTDPGHRGRSAGPPRSDTPR
jgi:Rrf2 family protein